MNRGTDQGRKISWSSMYYSSKLRKHENKHSLLWNITRAHDTSHTVREYRRCIVRKTKKNHSNNR